MKYNHKLAALATILLATPLAHAGIRKGDKDLKAIWFIGDSITQSNYDQDGNGSPRKSLFNALQKAGYTFTYTGNQQLNPEGFTPEQNDFTWHSGYSGSLIANATNLPNRVDMSASLDDFWKSGRLATIKPNLILILLGTNDVDQMPTTKLTTLDILKNYQKFIERILTIGEKQNPTILVSTIPPNHTDAIDDKNVEDFNRGLARLINHFKIKGKDVQLVDNFTPLSKDEATLLNPDKLHTNANGNNTMAEQWLNKIQQITK